MNKEIIISVKEAETLIHKGSLVLDRKEVPSVNDSYRVKMILNREDILEPRKKLVVLFSDVRQFEIYKSDEIAFVNHFRVPRGLLKITSKTYESSKSNKEEQASFIENEGYLKLRNGLLGMLHHKYEMQAFFEKDYNIERALQSFQNLSDIRRQLIGELLDKSEFPIVDVQSDKFISDISKRIYWWGFFIKDKYLSKLNIEEKSEIAVESEVVEEPVVVNESEKSIKSKSEDKTIYRASKHKSKKDEKIESQMLIMFDSKGEAADKDGKATKNKSEDKAKKDIKTVVEEMPSVEDETKKKLVVEDKNDKPKAEEENTKKQEPSIKEKQETEIKEKPAESRNENKTNIAEEVAAKNEEKDEPVKEVTEIAVETEKSNEIDDKEIVEGEKKEEIANEETPKIISVPEASGKSETEKEKPKAEKKSRAKTKKEIKIDKASESVVVEKDKIKTESKTEIRIKEIRTWLGGFMKLDDLNLLNKQLATIPQEIEDEVDFLLGYILAASYYDRYKGEEFFLNNQYEQVVYENKDELYSWVSFFVSLFRQDMHQLYFVKSLNSQVNKLERLAYDLSLNKLDVGAKVDKNIELKEIDRKELISEYFELTKGESSKDFEIVNLNKAKDVFENNLMKEKLPMIGMEKKTEHDNKGIIENYCMADKNRIQIVYNTFPDTEVIFYLDKKSKMNDELKKKNFKVKEISSLIDAEKKVLLIFNDFQRRSSFMSLYAELLNGVKSSNIKKAVVVILANTNKVDIRSIDFANEVKLQKAGFAQVLGVDVEVIVKDVLSLDDAEVKRNLKHALKDYKVNEIEVMHDNFNNKKASWVLDGSSEYFVEKSNQNYYSFFN